MLLFLLFEQFFYDLRLGDYKVINKMMESGDTLMISALDPLMSINVVQANSFIITQTLNGFPYRTYYNSDNITFFDFGGFTGNLSFKAKIKTQLNLEIFLFPNECNSARMVSNRLPFIFELTQTNQDPFFRITNDQIFCIWHVSQGPKNVSINMITELYQDTFKQMRERTDILTLYGTLTHELALNGSEYWFKWRTDGDVLSDYLSVQITNDFAADMDENDSSIIDFFSIASNYSKAVVLSKGKVQYVDDSSEIDIERKKSYIFIVIWVVVIFIGIIALVITTFFVFRKCFYGKFGNRLSNADAQELLDDFTLCNSSEILPQPISYNVPLI